MPQLCQAFAAALVRSSELVELNHWRGALLHEGATFHLLTCLRQESGRVRPKSQKFYDTQNLNDTDRCRRRPTRSSSGRSKAWAMPRNQLARLRGGMVEMACDTLI